jgi:3-deoxy-manno-octulosonate cytidylyltransferase (CMP-KDO synthetase)
MNRSVIIIPSRLEAKRLPNKPLLKINNIPMIIHVMERARESKIGDVIVATPDQKILDLVEQKSGKAILTSKDHSTGTDRVYEALEKISDDSIDIIINLQGDMPNLDPNNIKNLDYLMRKNKYDIGTLASKIQNTKELQNTNIVKVETFENLDNSNFIKAKDFFRKTINANKENIHHHIGIYAFSKNTLSRFVKLSRTRNEIGRKLEQMRALDNNIEIRVALSKSFPLGIDTEEDFLLIKKSMEYKG